MKKSSIFVHVAHCEHCQNVGFFQKKPLLKLGAYSPFNPRYFLGDPAKLEFDVLGRQQVVALVRVLLLKQFESSAQAFKYSCENLLIKLLSFIDWDTGYYQESYLGDVPWGQNEPG